MATETETANRKGRTRRRRAATADGQRKKDLRASRAALDILLTDANRSTRERFVPGAETVKLGAKLARRPGRIVLPAGRLGAELARVAAGATEIEPPRGDRRFADPAWSESWLFRRLMQGYLAAGQTLDGLIEDAELDLQEERRVRFAAENVFDALAPTNFPLSNPAALKAVIETGGANFVRGARNFARDMSAPPRLPASVDPSQFTVGSDLAATPGSVVLRTEQFELIQYAPQTEAVRSVPLLSVPPMVNRYYLVDLAPGRSLVEYLVKRGQQVFAMSWRNPDERHRDWDLESYAASALAAAEAVCSITGSERCHMAGNCSGGALVSAIAAHRAERGELDRIAGIMLGVCVIDSERAGTASAFMSREVAAASVADVARKGYLDGRALQGVFAWLRPNDLIWSYVVNNYLLGKQPPAFDILYWNADTTNLPAGLHRDLAELALTNSLAKPGAMALLGTPIDLGRVTVDAYIVAGITDHITPWESCYKTTQLLGGDCRFALSTSGHVAALVNPPGNPKATYRTGDGENPPQAEEWLDRAHKHQGTWWADWDSWLAERSGPLRDAPDTLGDDTYEAAEPVPGTYVFE
jgi:polyhydroxyalkanoate synthase subunit PhaC